jgi:regulator of protease activity HflC (stomatin/prohibitin superfamily)
VKLRVDIRVGHTLDVHHAWDIANETGYRAYEWKYFGGPIDQYMQSFASNSTTEEIIATKKNDIAPAIEAMLRTKLRAGLTLDYVRIGAIETPGEIIDAYKKREVTRAQIQTSEHQKRISEIKADEEAAVKKKHADALFYANQRESDADAYRKQVERNAEKERNNYVALFYERLAKNPLALQLRKIDTMNPNVKLVVVPDKDGGIYHIGGASDPGLV